MKRLFAKRQSRDSAMGSSPRPSVDIAMPVVAAASVEDAQTDVILASSSSTQPCCADECQEPVELSSKVKSPTKKYHQVTGTFKMKALMSNVREELQCPICLDEFVKPRLLHCGHSFCTGCLKSVCQNNTIRCPTCRFLTRLVEQSASSMFPPRSATSHDMRYQSQSYVMSSQNTIVGVISPNSSQKALEQLEKHPVDQLSLNYSILKVIEVMDGIGGIVASKKSSSAVQPQPNQPTNLLLDKLLPTPIEVKSQGTDAVLSSEIYQSQKATEWSEHMLLCDNHRFEEVQFWCNDCKMLLCAKCLVNGTDSISSHAHHSLQTLQDATQEQVKSIIKTNINASTHMDCLESLKVDIAQKVESMVTQRDSLKSQLQSAKATWLDHVEKWYDEQSKVLESLCQAELKALDQSKLWVQTCSHYLQQTSSSVAYILSDCGIESSVTTADNVDNLQLQQVRKRDMVKIWKDAFMVKTRQQQWTSEIDKVCSQPLKFSTIGFSDQQSVIPNALNIASELPALNVIVSMPEPQGFPVQVLLNVTGSHTQTINLKSNEQTVQSMIKKVEALTGMPDSKIKLYHQGKLLQVTLPDTQTDNESSPIFKQATLKDFDIESGSSIQLR